jgi:hypothetical protein
MAWLAASSQKETAKATNSTSPVLRQNRKKNSPAIRKPMVMAPDRKACIGVSVNPVPR